MDKLRALQYFVSAAAHGSFSGAARELDVSVPAVAKLVSALERELGIALFDRSTHGLVPTSRGETYLEACRPLLDALLEADRSVSAADLPSGTLVVGAPPLLARLCLVPSLAEFHAACPDVHIDLRPLDRLTITNAEAQGYDVIVALGWPGSVDLVQRRLAQSRLVVCASPAYWARHGTPQRPADLRSHVGLVVRSPEGTVLDLWRHVRDGEQEEVAVRGRLVSESRDLLLQAVLCGQGVGRFADLSIWPHLRDGTLQPALLDWDTPDAPPFSALYRRDVRLAPRVRVFVEFLVELFAGLEARCTATLGARPAAQKPDWYAQRGGRVSTHSGRG